MKLNNIWRQSFLLFVLSFSLLFNLLRWNSNVNQSTRLRISFPQILSLSLPLFFLFSECVAYNLVLFNSVFLKYCELLIYTVIYSVCEGKRFRFLIKLHTRCNDMSQCRRNFHVDTILRLRNHSFNIFRAVCKLKKQNPNRGEMCTREKEKLIREYDNH